ncbi:MAG: hypothetical protein FVQ82_02215 [Planctomycetes bacterium]|nr:hypothetical protein [Planctomycetota bacterium]
MKSLDVMKSFIIVSLVACLSAISLGGVVPVASPFYAGAEQTDARMIYVGGSGSGGKLAVDCHADFMVARDDSNVVQNWCNAGTFKWSFGFFSFDGPSSEYPSFNSNLNGSTAVTFDGGDKLRMILEPGFGYTLPSEITDGVVTVEMWIQNPSVQAGEVLISFEDSPGFDLTVDNFSMSGSTSWQHLVAISTGTQVEYYLNGSYKTTQAGAIDFDGNAVINLGAESFTGSIAAIRIHTKQMNATDISHNYTGGVGLGTYLFYPIHATDIEHAWWGDPDRSVDPGTDLRWHESAHFRSMWDEAENPNPGDDIGARILATQLDKLETVYTYMNEKSGKHLPLVSNDENKRGDGRKYKWIVGNGWGGAWSGSSPFGLGYGIFYAGYDNPHEYTHGTDGHQMNSITGQWWETHANFQVSWLGNPQVNPVTNCPKHAHVYPTTGGNYYHSYLIWDHLVESPEYGGLYVTRMWNMGPSSGANGNGSVFPPRAMTALEPSPATPFDHEWVKMAARNITWDYPSHPEYASTWNNWGEKKYNHRKHYTLLNEVPYLATGWYEPPKWRTPQQHGYNICALEANAGPVTADLNGFYDASHDSEWTAMFVAVDNGTPRYGEIFNTQSPGSFEVLAGDDELYLVVAATPQIIMEIGIFSNQGEANTDYRGASKDRFPYQVKLTGTTPKASLWIPSTAKNGFIAASAYVAPTAYIASGAQVLDNARVEDYAQVYGTVSGNAVVSGYAYINSGAIVTDNALVSDHAIIRGGSSIYGNARVLEHADIHGVPIYDYAVCKGNSEVSGPIHGNAMIDGNYIKNGDHSTGYQFLWAWGDYIQDGETYQDFGGLFLEYKFEQQNAYRVWDTYGATWARLINGASYASDHGGTVLDLDGVDQFVDLHSSVATSNDVSFVVDVKWDGGANGQRIFEFSNPNGDVCWLSPSDSQGKLSFGINVDGDEQVVRAANPLPTGVWKTVSVMMFDDKAVVQIDGFDWGSNDAFTHDVKDVSASVCYLGRGASGGYFDGRMDNFTIWSKSLIDVIPPTPDPAEFFVEPVSVTETEVAMFSKQGADAGGNVEYNFEEALGGTGADDSGWQGSRRYWDEDLDQGVTEYVYRVTMRDGSGNMTDSSAATRLTWQTTNKVYSQADDATGLAVIEAENYGRKAAGINGYEWEINTGAAGYLGSGAMMVSAGGANNGVDYDVKSPRMDYFIDFAKTGNHWVWVRAHGANPNADSYHLGDDMHASGWGYYQAWGTWNIYHWMKKGPFSVDSTGVHTINLWMREDGTRIDRLLVTSDNGYVPTAQTDGQGNVIGDGPAESASVTRTMLFKAAITDNTAPTPDSATFQTLPAGVSGYTISMTATTGTDASGGVEYYFEETSGTPGGTDSGWQSSATYSDFELTPDTSYSYRVRMRDIYGNKTAWSEPEIASTTNEVDKQAPTPNPAQFAVPPTPGIAQTLTMTAVVGTDTYGSVEYYFTETSGGLGGSNSDWQSSPTYVDSDLSRSTQYTYTVMMRDGLGNVGTASTPPVSGTTSSDKQALFSVDHDNLPAVGASVETWDGFTKSHGAPTVVELGGEKWYSNLKATTFDGMVHNSGDHAAGTSIPINGATIVTAVKPEREDVGDGGWCSIVDIFYDQLCMGIKNQTGEVKVKISGASGSNHTWTSTALIPEEPGVLTLSVGSGANPAFEVFWQGADDPEPILIGTGNGNTGGETYTALYAQANNRAHGSAISIGRGWRADNWSTYNGLIGDTYVFDEQLSAAALLRVQDAVRAAMGIGRPADTDAPTPDPATFASAPAADSDTAISMTATTGTDASGPVKYLFTCTAGGGNSSSWQTSASYTDSGLTASTQYTYTVTMRDALGNTGTASSGASATTDPVPDITGDGEINLLDLSKMAMQWGQSDCANNDWCDGTDLDMSGQVGLSDLIVLAEQWLVNVTTDPSMILIDPETGVTVSSEYSGEDTPGAHIVDDSGLSGGMHDSDYKNMWLSSGIGYGGEDTDPSVTFDLGAVYTISSFHVWNYNQAGLPRRGINNVSVEYGTTAALGSTVAGITNFAQATGADGYTGEKFDTFTPFSARYIKFDINSNHGDVNLFYGLSEVQFYGWISTP